MNLDSHNRQGYDDFTCEKETNWESLTLIKGGNAICIRREHCLAEEKHFNGFRRVPVDDAAGRRVGQVLDEDT